MKKFALIFALILVPLLSLAENSGDSNGQPFQELQAAVEAALAAEAAAREAADAAEASARQAGDTAEALERETVDAAERAARAAEDASLSARIAAEEVARLAADAALQAEIDAHDALLLGLDERVSILEGLHLERSVTWTETTAFDVTDIAGDIAGLNYQPGEWMFFVSTNAATAREFGTCTNHAAVTYWLSAAAAGTNNGAAYSGAGSYFFSNGTWYGSQTIQLDTGTSIYYQYLQIATYKGSSSFTHAVVDRKGNPLYINNEVFSRYSVFAGFGIGNTLTINVAETRLDACGF